ncbi:MAG: hypothetical protein HRT57_06265 [Crocinitomicaceae bacterium]|nr:hypothetical protein [Crocinitomicaceae bacterium]
MKILLTLFICCLSVISFSQDKKDNIEKSKNDLVEVRSELVKVDDKIQIINDRIDFSKETPASLSAQNTINDLNKKKDRLKKIELSILSHLSKRSSSRTIDKVKIRKSDFDKLPKQNQEQILLHPERYQVVNK